MRSMKKKPNIIFIITDDQGAWAVESETNHDIKTPNLKRLAESGVTFDEFYGLLTGKSQYRNWKDPFLPWHTGLVEEGKSGCLEISSYGNDGWI